MLYFVPMLIRCGLGLGIRCCDQFGGPLQAKESGMWVPGIAVAIGRIMFRPIATAMPGTHIPLSLA